VTAAVPIVKVQEPVPEHGPLQPANTDREEDGAAVSVTVLPALIALVFVQVPEVAPDVTVQLMPPVPLTVPLPVPAPDTVTVVALNVAVTDCAAVMLTVQAPVPEQAPPQPTNEVPAGALALRETDVPWTKFALQVAPQLMPAGELVTLPEEAPDPDFETWRAN